MLSIWHIIGIILTITLIIWVGVISGRNVTDAKSFTTGGTNGSWMVCGIILGTLVGGQATVGTAQLAFSFGISAWWFTLGSTLGCIFLALGYVVPLRRSGCTTLLEVVNREFGRKAETIGSMLCFLGIYISIIAQILAASAMITSLFHVKYLPAALISATLMALYVVFGGIKGAGMGGIVKLILLYVSGIASGVAVWVLSNGLHGLFSDIHLTLSNEVLMNFNDITGAEDLNHHYRNFLARGPLKDIGSCLSIILGVLSTQTYAQGVWSAQNNAKARKGSLLCAFLITPIGAACVMVGMYMRAHYVTAAELEVLIAAGQTIPDGIGVLQSSAQAFPTFILNHLPNWFGGIVLGTLLITVIGGGSGLLLGASTILVRDVFHNLTRRKFNDLLVSRTTILVILFAGVGISMLVGGSFINDLGFLSLGLRATAVLLPLSAALFFPKRIKAPWARASMIVGSAAMLAAKLCNAPADPVFWGMGAGLIVILLGRKKKGQPSTIYH